MDAFYSLLKEKFPNKEAILTEIINLEAICHLPKGTEHFVSDLHGEYEAFDYLLRTGSGSIGIKIQDCFRDAKMDQALLANLCLYIYYPEEKMSYDKESLSQQLFQDQLMVIIPLQIQVLRFIGNKYTRSKVRKALPKSFAYIIEELLSEIDRNSDKKDYFDAIITKIRKLNQLEELVVALSQVIQGLAVDVLHVVGDIFDRGAYPDTIINRLENLPNVDIQWGNHDVTWMGAVSGSYICMINVIRISARYNNIDLIENRYGINLRQLVDYSRKHYQPLKAFSPIIDDGQITSDEADLLNVIQQATAYLQFKLETQLIDRRPDFQMTGRKLLDKIDYIKQTITIGEKSYPLINFNPVCLDVASPAKLSHEEEVLLDQLMQSFQSSTILAHQIAFLFEKGAMYLNYNGNLLFHGCIPLHDNGDFKSFRLNQSSYHGKNLLDFFEDCVRFAYRQPQVHDDLATDMFWYLWAGEHSSLFGKRAMTTFERYFIADKVSHQEIKNPYYHLRNNQEVCMAIFREFGIDDKGHIINGHTPVKEKDGENPVKADGKMLVIDGGFAKGYQAKTGLAGYTLVYNSYGLQLISHRPFTSVDDILNGRCSIIESKRLVEEAKVRVLVKETNIGCRLSKEIEHLEHLYHHFENY